MKKAFIKYCIPAALLAGSATAQASDLEIYQRGKVDAPGLVLMFDVSGSMGEISRDYDCYGISRDTAPEGYSRLYCTISQEELGYKGDDIKETITQGCEKVGSNYKCFDRLTRMKRGIFKALEDPKVLGKSINIAIGQFNNSSRRSDRGVISLGFGNVQDAAHRERIKAVVRKMKASGGTPLLQSYGEAANFLLAKNTSRVPRGGFGLSHASAKTKSGDKYNGTVSQCGGASVYLLTDGKPNSGHMTTSSLAGLFGTAMGRRTRCRRWYCASELSRFLRTKGIRTTSVGLGGIFATTRTTRRNYRLEANRAKKDIEKYCLKGTVVYSGGKPVQCQVEVKSCSAIRDRDGRELCKLGQKGYGYGEGGYYYAKSENEIATSIIDAVLDSGGKPSSISTGAFSIPVHPVDPSQPRYHAYLPILSPSPGSKTLWSGNLKKYQIDEGAIQGENNRSVLDKEGLFAKDTYDYWNINNQADEGNPSTGGALGRIFHNTSDRKVFVDSKELISKNETLKTVSVLNKKPVGFDTLPTGYTDAIKRNLTHFLGYKVGDSEAIKDNQELSVGFSADHKVHGAVLHSSPQLLITEARVKDSVMSNEKSYMLYGSFDGALRLVDDATGKEEFAFLPHHVLESQSNYLNSANDKPAKGEKPIVGYGVDGTWAIYQDYDFDTSNANYVKTKQTAAIAFGGLRMGGSVYYALDLSNLRKPKLLYKVGSSYGAGGKKVPDSEKYKRMGQTWGRPSVGFLKKDKQKVMVNFLPGGYDIRYENPEYTATKDKDKIAMGNEVYVVEVYQEKVNSDKTKSKDFDDAGDLLKKISSLDKKGYMIHSIVSEVSSYDRDYDGVADHLYFADLGGQVFRVDIDNRGDDSKFVRLVRLLDVSADRGTQTRKKADGKTDYTYKDSAPRFYEAPLITFTRWTDSNIVGVVSVASGNRSSPLHKRVNDDKVYTFIDKDVAYNSPKMFNVSGSEAYTIKTKDLTQAKLEQLKFGASGETSEVKKMMNTNQKQGWYYPLQYWDNKGTAIKGLKSINSLNALNQVLFYTSFNPNVDGIAAGQCGPGVKGKTQRESLCLPYGACKKSGRGGSGSGGGKKPETQIAGAGLVENSFGFLNTNKVKGGVGIVVNKRDGDNQICKAGDPTCKPLNSAVSMTKRLFPLSWSR